jgi:hypothetical protein
MRLEMVRTTVVSYRSKSMVTTANVAEGDVGMGNSTTRS